MGVLSQEQLSEILFGIRDVVDNPNSPHILDRRQMPWHSMLMKVKKTVPFVNNQITIKYKSETDELDMQTWNNQDQLGFQEFRTGFDLTFSGTQEHIGMKFVHQELKDAGYTIVPNGPRSANFAGKISKVEALRMFDTLKEKIESAYDRWDVLIDQKFLHNVTGNSALATALTDLISKTPTLGQFGGRDRSDPQMQNGAKLDSTSASLRTDLNTLVRNAMLYNRGFKGAGVNVIMAAGGWLDRHSDAALDVATGARRNTDIHRPGPIDIGIPDTEHAFNHIPIVYNPTMDLMAELTGDDSWNRRAYGLNMDTFVFGHAEGEDKAVSFPLDPFDQRITRGSIDGRYMLYNINPRSNFVHEFAG